MISRLSTITFTFAMMFAFHASAQDSTHDRSTRPVDDQKMQLIVNSADAGLTHGINLAIKKCYEQGTLTTCAVIVPGPFFHHFAKYARENPGLTVGVHLAIGTGLYPFPSKPVAARHEISSMVDYQGFLFDSIQDLNANNPKFEHIKRELEAQVELAYMEGIDVAFLDNHIGGNKMTSKAIAELREEFGLPGKGRNGEIDIMEGIYMTPPEYAPDKMAMLIDKNMNKPGVYLSRHHPAWDTPEMRDLTSSSIHYKGSDFAAYRQGEATAIMSSQVRGMIKKKDIELIGFYKQKRDEIRAKMDPEKREALYARIAELKTHGKYSTSPIPYVFNGTPAVISKALSPVTIDGDIGEFASASLIKIDGSNEKNVIVEREFRANLANDLAAEVYIMYDDENIYVAARVKDATPAVNPFEYYEITEGDNVEVYLNTDSSKTWKLRGIMRGDVDDLKIILSPTSKSGQPVATCGVGNKWADYTKVASKTTEGGYIIEAAISRSAINNNSWKTGDLLRFDAAVTDFNETDRLRGKIWWHAEHKRAWQIPNYWGVAEIK